MSCGSACWNGIYHDSSALVMPVNIHLCVDFSYSKHVQIHHFSWKNFSKTCQSNSLVYQDVIYNIPPTPNGQKCFNIGVG